MWRARLALRPLWLPWTAQENPPPETVARSASSTAVSTLTPLSVAACWAKSDITWKTINPLYGDAGCNVHARLIKYAAGHHLFCQILWRQRSSSGEVRAPAFGSLWATQNSHWWLDRHTPNYGHNEDCHPASCQSIWQGLRLLRHDLFTSKLYVCPTIIARPRAEPCSLTCMPAVFHVMLSDVHCVWRK